MSGPIVTGRPVAPGRQRRILPPARYRHPGDVIRLLAAGLIFAGAAAATLATHGTYAGASATAVTALRLSTTAGRVLTGLMTAALGSKTSARKTQLQSWPSWLRRAGRMDA